MENLDCVEKFAELDCAELVFVLILSFFKAELERLFVNSGFEKIAKIKLGSRSVFARNYYFSGKLSGHEVRNFSKPRNVSRQLKTLNLK